MGKINLEQGTEQWLEWRQSKITATAAGVLMDHNPWKTPLELFNEMMGLTPPTPMNDAMKRGIELEPEAREKFEKMKGLKFVPCCWESDDHYWMGASLDGWCETVDCILEIKCPGLLTHTAAIQGIVPMHYEDQIQHQLYVTDSSMAYYVSYMPKHPTSLVIIQVDPKPEYIKQIIEVEKTFYFENICQFKPPEVWTLKKK